MASYRPLIGCGLLRKSSVLVLLVLSIFLLAPSSGECEDDGTIFTLWPLLDYRSSASTEFSNTGVAGPLIKYETQGERKRYGLRPLFFHEEQGSVSSNDFLYPLATYDRNGEASSFQFFHLFTTDSSATESGVGNEFMLFPFLFYGKPGEEESYFALFPLGGKILHRFGRDRIVFALFPLYSQTTKGTTENTNVLWPIITRTSGENESGWALWPLYGSSEKTGVYRKRFFLWPFFFKNDTQLNTPDPKHLRAFFPVFILEDSVTRSEHTYLWPFFSHIEDSSKDFEEWNFPWPLMRIAHGKDREVLRLLPFYADEQVRDNRSRWFLWPLYKIEETDGERFLRRRDRVLYFLYSDLSEELRGDEKSQLRRIALWPLFTYERKAGASQFYTLSLLEPFFPDNERIERSWSPLWRIYQHRWDDQGGEVTSFLWNLYWKERQADALAFELFPLFFYRGTGAGREVEISLLKGLYRYRRNMEQTCSYLLYLPWGICRQAEHATGPTLPGQE